MGSLKVRADCRVSGPLADGSADKAAEDWARNTTQQLGDKAVELLRDFPMNKSGRARGGFQKELKAVRKSPTTVVILGPQVRGVAWATWLEGVSKRNSSARFKGYRLFRKTRAQLNKMAPQVAQEELEKVLPKMGGE